MANYSLVINSRFKPFTYQELLAPAMQMTQAHQAIEEAYSELDTKASVWDRLANEQTDPKAHAMYKRYADDLRNQANELAMYGLNPTSRKQMFDMKSRYAKEIIPIETAYKKREADADAQRKVMMQDPTHRFNRLASETSLDEYINNPSIDVLSDNYSGALLAQQVGTAVSNFKDAFIRKGKLTSIGLPFKYERMLQKGYTPEEVMSAILANGDAPKPLLDTVDKVMQASGIRDWSSMNGDWANNKVYKELDAYARMGLYNAIGKQDIQMLEDSASQQDWINARQHARQVAENKRREAAAQRLAQLQNSQNNNNNAKGIPVNPIPLRSQEELKKNNAKIEKFIKDGFLERKNGIINWTPKGRKEYDRKIYYMSNAGKYSEPNYETDMKGRKVRSKATPNRRYDKTEFGQWMDDVVGANRIIDAVKKSHEGNNHPKVVEARVNYATNAIRDNLNYVSNGTQYDTYHSTGIQYEVNPKKIYGDIKQAYGKSPMEVVDYQKGKWKKIDTLKASDLKESDIEHAYVISTPTGGKAVSFHVKDSDEPIYVAAPGILGNNSRGGAVNPTVGNNAYYASRDAQAKLYALSAGYDVRRDSNGFVMYDDNNRPILDKNKPLTQAQRNSYDRGYYKDLQEWARWEAEDINPYINNKNTDINSVSGTSYGGYQLDDMSDKIDDILNLLND